MLIQSQCQTRICACVSRLNLHSIDLFHSFIQMQMASACQFSTFAEERRRGVCMHVSYQCVSDCRRLNENKYVSNQSDRIRIVRLQIHIDSIGGNFNWKHLRSVEVFFNHYSSSLNSIFNIYSQSSFFQLTFSSSFPIRMPLHINWFFFHFYSILNQLIFIKY